MSQHFRLPGLGNLSIKRKLMLIIMAVSTVAMLLCSAAFVTYELFIFKQSMVQDLSTLADIIGNQSTGILAYDGKESDAYEILSALSAKRYVVSACIYKRGQVYARYPRNPLPGNAPPGTPEAQGFRFENDHLVLFRDIKLDGDSIGVVYLKSDLRELHRRLGRYLEIILLFMLLSSLVTFLLSFLLQRIISEPIFHLAETAKAVSTQRNYSLRAAKHGQDELGQLIDGFNEMLAQIQERDAALQQAHDKLEKRVEERTVDLQAEISRRERAQEALEQQLTRISLLNQIAQVIADRQNLASILNVVLWQLEERLPIDFGMTLLYHPQNNQLEVAASRWKHPGAVTTALANERRIMLDQTGLASCQQGQTVYLADILGAEPQLLRNLASAGMRCVVAVPLTVEEKLFAILVVARLNADSFRSGECEFLRMLGEHVALAAHQAQLHSELENAYNELRQTQHAVMQQDRLRALGQMASGIAHDINNALSPVVGFAALLLQAEPNLSQSARKQLNYIRTAGEDVAHIVARLREFYRRRDEQEPLFALDLNRVAEQVIELTRPRWRDIPQGRGITVEMQSELAPGMPQIVGIESELREALTNLILNAVDAMPHGGKLTVRTLLGGLGYSGEKNPTQAILEVSDTGIGMDEATRQRCLEPFFSTKGNRGTGMGLAMVYGVMERHEGRIEISSKVGQGTTVRLVFPLPEKIQPGPLEPDQPAAPSPSPLRILCIDDEPLLRELLQDVLESDGHIVQVADSGETGLDAFRKASDRGRAFDIVITDLGMPFLDGRQVAKILKAESPVTPVVMLTGWGTFMKSDGDLPDHVDCILSKPPRTRELRETLARLTRR